MVRCRIAFLNIQSGLGVTRGYWEYLLSSWKYFLPHNSQWIVATASLVATENIDILCLVEVEGGSLRSKGIDQTKLLSSHTPLSHHHFFPTASYGPFAKSGQAILSRYSFLSSSHYRLEGGREARHLSESTVRVKGKCIAFFIAHLSLGRRAREKQILQIARLLSQRKGPFVLCGDFNTSDKRALLPLQKAGLRLAIRQASYPSWQPTKPLDAIFVSSGVQVKGKKVLRKHLTSDHLPLFVEFIF